MKDGEITRDGFLQLNLMEAEENHDNLEELWIPLETLGFNRSLVMDEVRTQMQPREFSSFGVFAF